MSNINDYLKEILSARYGKDVRQSIHDSILQCYEDGKAGAIDLVARQRIDTLESSALIRKIVDSLPTSNISKTTVYMIPNTQSSEDNIYDEYMYINESWEKIGSSAVDLTDYLKKDGDSSNNTVTFTSNDSGPDGEHAILSVDKLTTGEKISSIMNKISRIFTNTRYILDLLGTNDITSESVKIGDGTVTGALRTLNDSFDNYIPKKDILTGNIQTPSDITTYLDAVLYIHNNLLKGNQSIHASWVNPNNTMTYMIIGLKASSPRGVYLVMGRTSSDLTRIRIISTTSLAYTISSGTETTYTQS